MRPLLCSLVVLVCGCFDPGGGEDVASLSTDTLDLLGGEPLAHRTYVKPFNRGFSFGADIAADGDIVVVGAPLEASRSPLPGNHRGLENGAAYALFRSDDDWTQRKRDYLKASPINDSAHFGQSVAVDGTTVAVGEQFGAGAVHVFELSGTVWVRTAILRPIIDHPHRRFGHSVAVSGDTLVVGDIGDASASTGVGGDPNNTDAPFSGAAYVYVRDGAGWTLDTFIKPTNTEEQDLFGVSVALSGNTLAVATSDDSSATGVGGDELDNGSPNAGSVFVFERGPGGWAQQAYLKASNTDARDFFGAGLALSGQTLVVTASGEDSGASGVDGDQSSNAVESSGAAYVFMRDGATWSQQAYLKASNPGIFDQFGQDAALAGDRLVVGAFREASAAVGIDGDQSSNAAPVAGAAYLFERVGASWAQTHYIKATNTEAEDFFGSAVAWAGDTLLVGAQGEDSCATRSNGDQLDNRCQFTGAIYVLE